MCERLSPTRGEISHSLQAAGPGLAGRSAVGDVLMGFWKPGEYFILNSGCVIPPSTPAEKIRAFVERAREEGTYD
jgi:uroporphyrinogen-III decarboxylase